MYEYASDVVAAGFMQLWDVAQVREVIKTQELNTSNIKLMKVRSQTEKAWRANWIYLPSGWNAVQNKPRRGAASLTPFPQVTPE